ncbi:MAG: hypothetical protein QE265_02575 [Rhodoferax sp.]|nr:hypothetical protein [Rhodoferax sp.]
MAMTVYATKSPLSHAALSGMSSFHRWLTLPTVHTVSTVEPRWHTALRKGGVALAVTAYSGVWFWLGSYSGSGYPPPSPVASVASVSEPVRAPVTEAEGNPLTKASASSTPPDLFDPLQPEDALGLRIDSFRIGAVSGAPNRLRYELVLSNKGRKLVGKLQFVIVGEQNGELREMPLDQPAALTEAKPRVEVARMLNTRGFLDLPEGYVVHRVLVQVVEGSTPRVAQTAAMWPT